METLLPDNVPPSKVLIKSPPLLTEIIRAVCDHYRYTNAQMVADHTARGLIIVLARRYTRAPQREIGQLLGYSHFTNISSMFGKTHARMAHNELLRDDYDIIERRIAEMVLTRSGGRRCQ